MKAALGLCAVAAVCVCAPLRAQAASPDAPDGNANTAVPSASSFYKTPLRTSAGYLQLFSPLALGRGLRLNNPYRLQSSLGSSSESLSLTASYLDFGLGAVWGSESGIAHGGVAHLSLVLQGIPQEVLSLSYTALAHFGRALPFARAGVPLVIEPDFTGGLEAAVGSAYLLGAGYGLQGELVGSVYYGAATIERKVTVIPVLSLELGVWIQYEVLP